MAQPLSLALKARGQEGEALPPVFHRLDALGAKLHRGSVSLVAAAPGAGKSSFAVKYAVNAAYDDVHGVPSLYFSADCDRMTLSRMVAAGIYNRHQQDLEHRLTSGDPDLYRKIDAATDHVWWCFESAPFVTDIYQEVDAYAHVHGEYPHLIVVDNLMDVTAGGSEYEKFSDVVLALNDFSRVTGAHIMLLCHVTGDYTNGNIPVPRSAIIQKIDKKPRLILTLYQPQEGVMGIRVVKNTNGPARADGTWGVDYAWISSMGWFGE